MSRDRTIYLIIVVVAIIVVGSIAYTTLMQKPPVGEHGPVTVTDFRGKQVIVDPSKVDRVVVIGSYWVETVCVLGCSDRIVGVDKYTPYNFYVPESVKNVTTVGSIYSGLDIETILSLEPDLVIMDIGYGKAEEYIAQLEEANVTVIGIFCTCFNDQIKAIEIIGKALGADDRASQLINYMQNWYNQLRDKVKNLSTEQKPRVVVVSAYALVKKGEIQLYANTSFGKMVEELGAINIALQKFPSEKWPKINEETLLSWNPDIIIFLGSSNYVAQAVNVSVTQEPWTMLKAVKEDRVYGIVIYNSKGAFLNWGPRIIIGYMQMAVVVHPDIYSDLDWVSEAKSFLENFYGITLSEEEIASSMIRP